MSDHPEAWLERNLRGVVKKELSLAGRKNMNLRIWIEDDRLSPDAEISIYADIMLKFDLTVAQMQQMALELATQAREHYTNREAGEVKIPDDTSKFLSDPDPTISG